MNGIERIEKVFAKPGMKLMTHVVGGYPDLATSERVVLAMAKNGADLIEVQLPFSDPSADGPAIVHANYGALAPWDDSVASVAGSSRRSSNSLRPTLSARSARTLPSKTIVGGTVGWCCAANWAICSR